MVEILTSVVSGLLIGTAYAAMALGFSLALGTVRTLNLAHTAVGLVFLYLLYVAMHRLGLDVWLAFTALLPVMFVVGVGLYYVLVRSTLLRARDGVLATGIVTLGLSIVIENALNLGWGPSARAIVTPLSGEALQFGGVHVQTNYVVGAGLAGAAVTGVYLFLHRTTHGMSVRAVAQQYEGALLQGVRVDRVSALTFGLGSATAAVGGLGLGLTYTFSPVAYFEWLLYVFLIVTIAGSGTILGCLWSGLIIGGAIGLTGAFLPIVWNNLVVFGLLLVILLVRPTGLFRT